MNKTTSLTKGPGAQRIKAAFKEAEHAASNAVQKAMICGQLLAEQRAALSFSHDGKNLAWQGAKKDDKDKFSVWLAQHVPEIGKTTAYRWMELAERCLQAVELLQTLSIGNSVDGLAHLPLSQILTAPVEELPKEAQEARQLLFDFTSGKTMKECLAGVVVDGDPAHRVTRAHNGATKGGTKGENRKDWPKFIGVKLSDISTHLEGWDSYTPAQVSATLTKFDSAVANWPTAVLEHLRERIKEELKTR